MNLNKTLGRVATTLVAATMLASVTAVPAFADEPKGTIVDGTYDDVTNAGITEFYFDKVLERPNDVARPTVSLNFELMPDDPEAGETATDSSQNQATVTKGILPEGTEKLTALAAIDGIDEEEGTKEYTVEDEKVKTATTTQAVKVDVKSIEFKEPGVYKYKLVETDPTTAATDKTVLDDITKSDVTRTVYLYVERQSGKCVVTGVTLYNGEVTLKEGEFTNPTKTSSILDYYMLEGDPDEPDPEKPPVAVANDLTVTKNVAGEMGNKSEPFAFDITIGAQGSGKTYKYTITKDGKTGTTQTVNAGTKIPDVSLEDGDSIKITGISASDTFTVTETAAANDGEKNAAGYTTKYSMTGNNQDTNKNTVTGSLAKQNGKPVSTTITFTNTRNAVSPTGIVMNVAPYVLLVVVAAAGCFVFLRKRRED